MAKGKNSDQVKVEFLIHASEEMIHADLLANRIVELGGAPNFSLDCLGIRSRTEYVERDTLKSMIKKDLIAERIAIENYTYVIEYIGEKDPITKQMFREILASEESHVDDLAELLMGLKIRKR